MSLWDAISGAISEASGKPFRLAGRNESQGGCINRAQRLTGADGSRWFIKLNRDDRLPMFVAEAAGLRAINAASGLRAPSPLCTGSAGGESWLVMEYLGLSGRGDPADLGRGLAAMHRHAAAAFGWHMDNTIGATPQINTPSDDWLEFWRDRRLLCQLHMAAQNGLGNAAVEGGERLAARLAGFFPGYLPTASLLHGDLWSGNAAYAEGAPVVFDPAPYYGDRETDIAMTELFGAFDSRFYAAYRESCPLDPGYPARRDLYNLYHVLNHFNLFGGGYGAQAARMIERLLALSG
jgi:protein-ribulosamine 3-kinase